MLDPHVLDAPLQPATAPATDGRQLHRAAELADRGDYAEAAELAAQLLSDGLYDIRLIGYYFVGVFLDHGVAILPAILDRLASLLSEEMDLIEPDKKRERAVDTSLAWLLRTVGDRCHYHSNQHDEPWRRWVDEGTPDLIDAARTAGDELGAAIGAIIEPALDAQGQAPRSYEPLGRLRRWLDGELAPAISRAIARAARSQAQVETQGDADASAPDDAPEELRDLPAGVPGRSPGPTPPGLGPDALSSPAMSLLCRKLAAFEWLMEQQDFARAAVVASDIREVISNFDPLVYLPKLFSHYFRLLSVSVDELMPYWEESDSPAWQALEQFYRTDLDGFLDR
ncbi:type VI secretion system protein IglI family protein [Haliangium sp.]|uniref:type VI secretion system protein IglI family protein n=1 Tax=Haliangium sp. TaxID=2663208 RepID=UPI003D1176C9